MLTRAHAQRIDIPHEPGQWIEARPVSIADSMVIYGSEQSPILAVLQRCITAWSYEAEVSPETVADLDIETAMQVYNALMRPEGEDAEKNSSGASTTPSTGRAGRRTNG